MIRFDKCLLLFVALSSLPWSSIAQSSEIQSQSISEDHTGTDVDANATPKEQEPQEPQVPQIQSKCEPCSSPPIDVEPVEPEVDPIEYQNLQNNLDQCIQQTTSLTASHALMTHDLESIQSQLTAALQENKSLKTSLIGQITEVNSKLNSKVKEYDECRKDAVTLQSDHNDVLQELTSVKDKMALLQSSHKTKVQKLMENIREKDSQFKKEQMKYKSTNEKYLEVREKVTGLEEELRRMQYASQRTYVNTTLIVEDVTYGISKSVDCVLETVEELWQDDRVARVKEEVRDRCMPFLEMGGEVYNDHCKHHVQGMMKKLKGVDLIEGVRLTAISSVKQGSKTILNYLELTDDKSNYRQRRVRSSKWMRMMVGRLRYMEKNSEKVVHMTVGGLLGYFVIRLVLGLIFGVLFAFLRMLGLKKKKDVKSDMGPKSKVKKEVSVKKAKAE